MFEDPSKVNEGLSEEDQEKHEMFNKLRELDENCDTAKREFEQARDNLIMQLGRRSQLKDKLRSMKGHEDLQGLNSEGDKNLLKYLEPVSIQKIQKDFHSQ